MPSDTQDAEKAPSPQSRRDVILALRWPATLLLGTLLLIIGALVAYKFTLDGAARGAEGLGRAADAVADRAERMASAFFTGDVTESFISSMPEIDRSGVGRLEVAALVLTEKLARADERRMFFDVVPLGTTKVEIEVPVTYRYHVPVTGDWHIEVRGPVCLVIAPPLEPTLPPAIHTDRLRSTSEEGLLRFDAGEQMAELQRSLTPRLSQRAASPQYMELVRDEARRGVADFVRAWLLRQDFWVDDRFSTIRVVFADEPESGPTPPPTPAEGPG
ncbi:MAG: hypothetical protein AAGM22_18280 [Acidobacteriota bacterium]